MSKTWEEGRKRGKERKGRREEVREMKGVERGEKGKREGCRVVAFILDSLLL